ncbi:MAG: hypothetical protein Q8Q50_10115 [Methylobacter sp.]|nr:hypothetical protein [Methylobacter sp.]
MPNKVCSLTQTVSRAQCCWLHPMLGAMNRAICKRPLTTSEWLKDLLDRYQPLPAPLFE